MPYTPKAHIATVPGTEIANFNTPKGQGGKDAHFRKSHCSGERCSLGSPDNRTWGCSSSVLVGVGVWRYLVLKDVTAQKASRLWRLMTDTIYQVTTNISL